MKFKKSQKLVSLKEATKISGYNSDYIGRLIRTGKLEGKKIYSGVSWQTTKEAILEYKSRKALRQNIQDQNRAGSRQRLEYSQEFISLKEAARISGYAPDYIGCLIREKKILGKKDYIGVSWQVDSEAIRKYRETMQGLRSDKKKLSKRRIALARIQPSRIAEILGFNNAFKTRKIFDIFNIGWRFGFAAFVIFFAISGFAPIRFLQSSLIGAIAGGETKIVNFYAGNFYGEWQNSQNVQGSPDVLPIGGIDSFSEANSAVYKTGPLVLICEDFSSDELSSDELSEERPVIEGDEGSGGHEDGAGGDIIDEGGADDGIIEEAVEEETGEVGGEGEETGPPATGGDEEAEGVGGGDEEGSYGQEGEAAEGTEGDAGAEEGESGEDGTEQGEEPGKEKGDDGNESIERKLLERVNPVRNTFLNKVKGFFGFEVRAQGQTKIFKSAKIKFSFAIDEQKSDLLSTGNERATAGELSYGSSIATGGIKNKVENIWGKLGGAWDEIKDFFSGLVNPVRNAFLDGVEKTILIVKAEEGIDSIASVAPTALAQEDLLNLDTKIIIWYSLGDDPPAGGWQKLGAISEYPLSNALNEGYFSYDASFLKSFDDVKNLKIKFEGVIGGESDVIAFLDSVWVEASYKDESPEDEEVETDQGNNIEFLSGRDDFQLSEEPEFRFWYQKKSQGLLASIGDAFHLTNYWNNVNVRVGIKNPKGEILDVLPDFSFENNGELSVRLPRHFLQKNGGRPGLYKIILKIEEDGEIKEFEKTFSWGVLAINVNKSIYSLGDQAFLQMAVLDEEGHTICDADLTLEITAPDGAKTIFTTQCQGQPSIEEQAGEEKQGSGVEQEAEDAEEAETIEQGEQEEQEEQQQGEMEEVDDEQDGQDEEQEEEQQQQEGEDGNEEGDEGEKEQREEPQEEAPERKLFQRIFGVSTAKAETISETGVIYRSPECGPQTVTNTPDYYTYYNVAGSGEYQLNLTAVTKNGAYSITDSFEVRELVPFDVERIGPTRIYPPATYEMTLKIKANQDFTGQITESVPTGFEIDSSVSSFKFQVSEKEEQGEKNIIWEVDCKAGEAYELQYTFNAPDISPYLYLLGPLRFEQQIEYASRVRPGVLEQAKEGIEGAVEAITEGIRNLFGSPQPERFQVSGFRFQEIRQWQIAADAATKITVSGTHRLSNRNVVRASDGTLYAIISDTSYKTIECWKSSDGSIWTEQDSADRPTSSQPYVRVSAAIDSNDKISVAWNEGLNGFIIGYAIFDTASTSWGSAETVHTLANNLTTYDFIGISIDSNDKPHIVFQTSDAYHGTNYDTVFYTNKVGVSWKGVVEVDGANVGPQKDCRNPDITVDENDYPIIAYQNFTDGNIAIATSSANDAASFNLTDIETSAKTGDNNTPSIAVDSSGNWNVAYIDSTDDLNIKKEGQAVETIDSGNNLQNPSLVIDGTDRYVFAEDASSSDIVYYTDSSGSWSSQQTLETGTYQNVKAKWAYCVNNGSDSTNYANSTSGIPEIDYLFSDGTDIYWNKLVLGVNLTQNDYRWYENIDAITPTSTLAAENASTTNVADDTILRLRTNVTIGGSDLSASTTAFKLQYATSTGVCTSTLNWQDVGQTASTTIWRGYDNASVSDGTTTVTTTLSTSDVLGSYEEANPSVSNPNAASTTDDIEYDWVIENNSAAAGTAYCFRMVESDGTALNTYNSDGYPQLTTVASDVTVSGTIYTNEGETTSTAGHTVGLAVDGVFDSTTTASTSTGLYTFSSVTQPGASTVLTVFLDEESDDGVTVTRYIGSGNATGLDIYYNRIIVRHEDAGPITISDLDKYDDGQDADILYTATTSALSVDADTQLYIWPQKEFAPGGNVTLDPGGSGDAWDGSLKITSNATFTASSAESHSVGGSWFASSTANFTAASSTVTFAATTTGKTITTAGNSFYDLTFDGSGGGWILQDSVTTTDRLNVTDGTVTWGDGDGDNLSTAATTTISSGAKLESKQDLAQGSSITWTASGNIFVSGTLDVAENTTINLNSSAGVEDGIEVKSTGYLEIQGEQSATSTVTSTSEGTASTTITVSGIPWSTGQFNNMHLRISSTSSLAFGKIYDVNDTATSTVNISATTSVVDESPDVQGGSACSGSALCVIDVADGLISANNEGIGRYLYNVTNDDWYLIVDSVENTTDTITIISDSPDAFTTMDDEDDIKIVDGIRATDEFEILDYALITAHSSNHGYIYCEDGSETLIRYADISELGADTATQVGIYFYSIDGSNADEGATIEKSRLYDSYRPIFFDVGSSNNNTTYSKGISNNASYNNNKGAYLEDSSNSNTLSYNIFYSNTWEGIQCANSADNNTVSHNISYSNHRGFSVYAATGNTISNNTSYNNSDKGIFIESSPGSNTISSNICYSNPKGIGLGTSPNNIISSNTILNSSEKGIQLDTQCHNNILSSNVCYSNTQEGIQLWSSCSNNVLFDNTVHNNGSRGISIGSSTSNIAFSNDSYDNSGAGIYAEYASDNLTLGLNDSYSNTEGLGVHETSDIIVVLDNYGAGGANSDADVEVNDANVSSTIRCYSCDLNSSTEYLEASVTSSTHFISFKHDSAATSTKLWGEYAIPDDNTETPNDEGTNKFNYTDNLWEDSFTPHGYSGSGDEDTNIDLVFSGGTMGGATSAVAYMVTCNAVTSTWTVYRDAVNIGTATTSVTSTDAANNVQFTIGDPGGNYAKGDSYTFTAFKNSSSTNNQKYLTMMQDGDTFIVGSGETIGLKGQSNSANRTTVSANTGNYSFDVNGGTIDAQYYDFDDTDDEGLHIYGSATITELAGGNFDNIKDTATSSYLRLENVTTTATYTLMVFDDNSDGADSYVDYSVWADGAGIDIDFTSYSGNKTGEDSDNDLNNASTTWASLPPIDLTQYENDHTSIISTGGTTNDGTSTNIYLDFNVKGSTSTDLITPKVEVEDVDTAFDGSVTASSSSFYYGPTDGPPVTNDPSVVYDEHNNRFLVFGGNDRNSTALNDVWELSFGTKSAPRPQWRQLSPTGTPPAARYGAASVFDSANNRMIIFGGYGASGYQDTWELDCSTRYSESWNDLSLAWSGGDTGGISNIRNAMSYDSTNGAAYLFGGWGDSIRNYLQKLDLTSGSESWSESVADAAVGNPDDRYDHITVYDDTNGRLIISSGYNGSYYNDTWEYDVSSSTFTQLSPTGTAPATRQDAVGVYDSANERMLIFGGIDSGGNELSDIYELDLTDGSEVWTDMSPTSSHRVGGRQYPAGAYDPNTKIFLTFSGEDGSGVETKNIIIFDTNDTSAPMTMYSSQEMSYLDERDGMASAFDSTNNVVMLFGGLGRIEDDSLSEAKHLGSIWLYNRSDNSWFRPSPPDYFQPSPREGSAAVWDSTNERFILFGGLEGGESHYLNDVWELESGANGEYTLNKLDPSGTYPSARWLMYSSYDSVNNRMIIFGGGGGSGDVDDTWELDLTDGSEAWAELSPTGTSTPSARNFGDAIYDSNNGRMLIFGGDASGTEKDELWELDLTDGSEAWVDRTPASSPAARKGHKIAYDGQFSAKRLVLFAGYNGASYVDDVWSCDITTPGNESWTEVISDGAAGSPSARRSHIAEIDSNTNVFITFGGKSGSAASDFLKDTWELSLESSTSSWDWTQLNPNVYLRASVPVTGLTASTSYHWQAWHTGSASGDSAKASFGNNSDTPTADADFIIAGGPVSITVSGTIYTNEGETTSTAGHTVGLAVDGVFDSTTTASTSTGLYTFSSVTQPSTSTVLTVFLDEESDDGVTVTRYIGSGNATGLDIYYDRIIVRHEDAGPITISDLDKYDDGEDADILYTATTSPSVALSVDANTQLYIWPAKEFAPGGNVTLDYGGSGDVWDGTLKIASNATFTASGAESHSIGGSWFASSTANFTAASSTITFTATTTDRTITTAGNAFYKLTFNGSGGGWTFEDAATTTNDFTITTGAVTSTSGILAVGGSLDNSGGTFNHNDGTVKLFATATGKDITPGSSHLYNLTFNGSGGGWTFATGTDPYVDNDFTITDGAVTSTDITLHIAGSWLVDSNGTFNHPSGTVTFDSSDTGETINPGGSSFNIITFDSVTGGWTITANATSTGNWNITNATSFTATSSITIEVKGDYNISTTTPSATTWTGSTLYLNGASQTIGNKSQSAETYATLKIGVSTDVKMWNSTSTTSTVDSSGSLYSMDHNNANGSLYIWGDFHISSGNEYWSYAKDFDGTAGADRQCNVKIATNATTTVDGGELQIIGTAAATTTIDRQITEKYALQVTSGTLNAQYYQIRNINSSGLNLSGTPTITSLDYGDFSLEQNDWTMLTVASTTIDQNSSKTITGCGFSTSTGIATGYNVTADGTTSNWWKFTACSGNYYGEDYDNDSEDPGEIRWDDSSVSNVQQLHFRWRNNDGGE